MSLRSLKSRAITLGLASSTTYYALTGVNNTTGNYQASLLFGLLGSSGTLATYPQRATPVSYGNDVTRLCSRIRLHYMEVSMRFLGSQSNTLASGDLFNTMKVIIYRSGESFQDSNTVALTNVDTPANLLDVDRVYYQSVIPLSSTAFDSSTNYNVPRNITRNLDIPLNFDLLCWSTTSSGSGAQWDTKKFNIVVEAISDSSVSPNPQFAISARTYFSFL